MPPYYHAPSGIHGIGLFAGRAFKRGERIGVLRGVRTQRDGPHVLWIWHEDGTAEGLEVRNPLRFVNHSSRPNAVFDGRELYVLRAIAPHQEITAHYGEDWNDVP
jgi:hypothetical protein